MKRALLTATVLAISLHALLSAQQGGVNISVLPALATPPDAPDGYLRSDQLAQKQVEGSLAFSTRNHLKGMAAFIHYGAVSIAELGLGESARSTNNPIQWLARLFFRNRPERPTARAATPEAWVGTAFTYDLTNWSGGFVPGGPFDNSPASLASPVKQRNYQAATDPWVTSAPCGKFHVVFIPFTRFQGSAVAVANYEDMNNQDGQHTIKYLGTTIIETANNATHGPFHDLPYATVDPTRLSTGNPCSYNLYVTWMTFQGNADATRANFAKSTDQGLTFSKRFVSTPAKTNQRAVIAVDPRPGTPTTNGGGTIWVGMRSFNATANGMWASRSIDYGEKFEKAIELNGTPIIPLDQQTQSSDFYAPTEITFRSNAYMTFQAVPHPNNPAMRTLFAAWTERVNMTACATAPNGPTCGRPDPNGEPRIVMMKSTDAAGAIWTDLNGAVGKRKAIDFADRDASATGLGYLPQARPSGAQIQPQFSFAGGRFGLFYLESRSPLVGVPGVIAGLDPNAPDGDWRGPQIDARFALLDPVSGARLGTSQISRYPVKADAPLPGGVDNFDAIAEVVPGSPSKQVNYKSTFPNSGGGKSAFIGDYTAASPVAQYVLDKTTGRWRWATLPDDQPFPGFHVLWADSRHLQPPSGSPAVQVSSSPAFNAATLPACSPNLGGSRNHDIKTALVNANVLVGAATTFKFGTIKRAFPITVTNGAAATSFRLTFSDPTIASFDQNLPNADQLDIQILPYSSATPVAYLDVTTSPTPVTVNVVEVQCPHASCGVVTNGQTGSVTLNLDPSNPNVPPSTASTEKHNPLVTAPLVTGPLVTAPLVTAPMVTAPLVTASGQPNPLVTAPLVTAPLVTASAPADWNGGVTEVTWTITGDNDTVNSGLYTQVFLDNAAAFSSAYGLELRIYRRTSYTMVVQDPDPMSPTFGKCISVSVPQEQLISSIKNPLVTAPLVTAPFAPENAANPLVTAATFAASPPDEGAGASTISALSAQAAATPTGDLRDARDNRVYASLIGYWRGTTASPPFTSNSPPAIAVVAQSINIVGGVQDPAPVITFSAPDLVVSSTTLTPATAVAGGQVTLNWTLQNTGNSAAAAADGAFSHTYVFSTNNVLGDGDDDVIGSDTTVGALAAGASLNFSKLLTIPDTATTGTRYIFIVADSGSEVSEAFEDNNSASTSVTIVPGLAVLDTDYARAGLGGLRGTSSGTINLALPEGASVNKALLFWHGPTNSTDPAVNATIKFRATDLEVFSDIIGTNIGFADDNNWGFVNSQAYRADVTNLVSDAHTSYAVSNLRKTHVTEAETVVVDADINGLSLLVFYSDGNGGNNRDVYLFEGNDSNFANPFEGNPGTSEWNRTMSGINYSSGQEATLEVHVGDGQRAIPNPPSRQYIEGPLSLNNTTIAAQGHIFDGETGPDASDLGGGPGSLWDVKSFPIDLEDGSNTLTLTMPLVASDQFGFQGDFLSLVVAAVIIGPPATTITFESPSLGVSNKLMVSPYVDSGVTFTAEPSGDFTPVVGLVKNAGTTGEAVTSACVPPESANQLLGTGVTPSEFPESGVGLSSFKIRATFSGSGLAGPVTISVDVQTLSATSGRLQLYDSDNVLLATGTAIPPSTGICPGNSGEINRGRVTVSAAIASGTVAYAIIDTVHSGRVFVIDNFTIQ